MGLVAILGRARLSSVAASLVLAVHGLEEDAALEMLLVGAAVVRNLQTVVSYYMVKQFQSTIEVS